MKNNLSRLVKSFVFAGLALWCLPTFVAASETIQKTVSVDAGHSRMIVLSDIEADPDDTESMVRLLLYSNEIDVEGLIATTSTHMKNSVHPDSIRSVIDAYGDAYENLIKHEKGFPRPDVLKAQVKTGRAEYGMSAVGEGKDSEGSQWIIQNLKRDDPRPLWISVWGGPNTLAQALYKLRFTESTSEVDRLVAKLRVYAISDQDDSGPWIRKNFKDLFYIVSPGGYGAATWTGINGFVQGIDNTTISNRWLADHIQQKHGKLGAAYPDVSYGMEGDTPSWLNLIPNGLSNPEHPNWGGWGGRYENYIPELAAMDPTGFNGGVPVEQETRPIWTNAVDNYSVLEKGEYGRATRAGTTSFKNWWVTLWRWRDDFQNDFAARMEWVTKPYEAANHPPVPVLDGDDAITVGSGQGFGLGAHRSYDPDGDSLSFVWFNYAEAGSWKEPVAINSAENGAGVWVTAPKVSKIETLHFILRLTDKGTPALTRYKRVVVTVQP